MSEKFVVLAAIDLTLAGTLVLDRALALASNAAAGELHVLAVSEPQVPVAVYPGLSPPPELAGVDEEALAKRCRERLDAFVEAHPSAYLPHVHVHTSIGIPADEIVWLGAHLDADLIVVGSHGRRGFKRLLLGSVSEKVVRLAGCPVVVVRDKNHKAEWRVPEIEPICPECAKIRTETAGKELWCERHKMRHARAHVYGYGGIGSVAPRAWESSTGR
jgi:nucleotide-binding universal stress UspA family protein